MRKIRPIFLIVFVFLAGTYCACTTSRDRQENTVVIAATSQSTGNATTQKHTPFYLTLMQNWESLDTNRDGELVDSEIDRAVGDISIKGNDAAAAAALKLLTRTARPAEPLTQKYFNAYDQVAIRFVGQGTANAEQLTADPGNAPSDPTVRKSSKRSAALPTDWDMAYAASLKRIARRVGPTWRSEVSLEHVRQGPLGDCFFVASLGSLVIHRPKMLEEFIEPRPDGSYVAHFPSTQPIIVPPLSDGQLAISSTSAGDGAWVAVMEQAFGKYRGFTKGTAADADGTDSLWRGGDTALTMRMLTGHATRRIPFARTMQVRASKAEKILPELRDALVETLADHRFVTASVAPPATQPTTKPATVLPTGSLTNPATLPVNTIAATQSTTRPTTLATSRPTDDSPHIPPNISTRHAYAVVGYDRKTDLVEIWNPHGQSFRPRGRPGVSNGYLTDHGRFKLPLTEAYTFFSGFTFELTTPAPSPSITTKPTRGIKMEPQRD